MPFFWGGFSNSGDFANSDGDFDFGPLRNGTWCQPANGGPDVNIPDKYGWVYSDFGECVMTDIQFAGFMLGNISNLCWLVAQAPQLYMNFKAGSAEALSLIFLADWLLGDITNLVGCLLTKQTQTQLFTAFYFCVIDTMMVSQWLYYNKCIAKKSSLAVINSMLVPMAVVGTFGLVASTATVFQPEAMAAHHGGGRSLLSLDDGNSTDGLPYAWSTRTGTIGYFFGWVSGVLYFTSRLPQIYKNYKRKTCEGLAPLMFLMAVLGNTFYACGVLMISIDGVFIVNHLPWLLGSLGTLMFDFLILMQYLYYGSEAEQIYKPESKIRTVSSAQYEDDDPLLK